MKTILATLLIVFVHLTFQNFIEQDLPLDSDVIEGEFIFIYHPNVTAERRNGNVARIKRNILDSNDAYSHLMHVYDFGSFHGFAARMSAKMLQKMEDLKDDFLYVEKNRRVSVHQTCFAEKTTLWGLDRISEKYLPLDTVYRYTSGPNAVNAYVVDTGIYTAHSQFEGRAKWGTNTIGGPNEDCDGHGTHVAGTIGGVAYGVAKQASLIAVKVLDCSGSGTDASVIAGIEWVVREYESNRIPSVINMSLGGGKSTALNNAVAAAITDGVNVVVSAGNSNKDACNYSPASAPGAIAVGATYISKNKDTRSSFSNWGPCVDIFAPGQYILSAYTGSTTATRTLSGTSMSSPHVAGVAAIFLSRNPAASTTEVTAFIKTQASTNMININCRGKKSCSGTPNLLLYSPCQ